MIDGMVMFVGYFFLFCNLDLCLCFSFVVCCVLVWLLIFMVCFGLRCWNGCVVVISWFMLVILVSWKFLLSWNVWCCFWWCVVIMIFRIGWWIFLSVCCWRLVGWFFMCCMILSDLILIWLLKVLMWWLLDICISCWRKSVMVCFILIWVVLGCGVLVCWLGLVCWKWWGRRLRWSWLFFDFVWNC